MFFMGFQRTKRKGSESPFCRLFSMSATLDFRKCKRLLLSLLAVSPQGFSCKAMRAIARRIPYAN